MALQEDNQYRRALIDQVSCPEPQRETLSLLAVSCQELEGASVPQYGPSKQPAATSQGLS